MVAYHLWPRRLTGGYVGVDVFFVISGFLITTHLLQHPPAGARDLLAFWGRRIRRLLPAAFLVLFATLVAVRVLAPETVWAPAAREVIASALYVQNWVLAGNAVDYLAAGSEPTPTQHYWSLSVEEQFYVFWPMVILATAWLARRFGVRLSVVAGGAMLLVTAASLGFSIIETATEPAAAYFVTPTRVWELALGGLIACLPAGANRSLPARGRDVLAWLGLGMILVAAVTFTSSTPFPGAAALLPCAGSALVIFAESQRRTSPTGILGLRPIQHIGDTSYSVYLWHWPIITLARYVTGEIGRLDALVIVAVTLVLGTITKVLVEDPFRFAVRMQALKPTFRFAAAGMVAISVLGTVQLAEAQVRTNTALEAARAAIDGPGSCIGAEALVRGFDACPPDPAAPLALPPAAALKDVPDSYADKCVIDFPFSARLSCTYGPGPVRIALVGNSHANQWLPALQVLADRYGWSITTFLTQQCNATDAELQMNTEVKIANCLDYGRWVLDRTSGSQFDLVITSERQSAPIRGRTMATSWEPAAAGYTSYLRKWLASGAKVLVLQDTPYPGKTVDYVPNCLAEHPDDHAACDGTPRDWVPHDPLWDAALQLADPNLLLAETRQWFCTASVCPAVIGSIIVYADRSHMTSTYSRSIARYLAVPILAALGSPGASPGPTGSGTAP